MKFERARDAKLVTTTKGPALHIERPQRVIRLSTEAATIFGALPGSADEVADATRIPVARVRAVLEIFAARDLVVRVGAAERKRSPTVTVVIPAYERPEGTLAAVSSILASDYPSDALDVIVVDDASPEPLAIDDVKVLRLAENGGPSIARNAGLEAATGELVAFVDNDCIVAKDWLGVLVAALEEPRVDVAGGRAIAPPAYGVIARYEAARSPLDMGPIAGEVGLGRAVPYLPTTNLVVRRSTAIALAGFRKDMRLGEDVDFIWRAAEKGSRVRYESAATVVHHHRERLPELLRRRAEYASSEPLLTRLHPASRRVLTLPVTVFLVLISTAHVHYAWSLAVVAAVLVAIEIAQKLRSVRALGLPTTTVARAVIRGHGASLFHLSAALSRYYGLVLIALGIFCPPARAAVTILLLVHPLVDARIRKARVWRPVYIALYLLESGAYQIGLVWGDIRHRQFSWPRIRVRR